MPQHLKPCVIAISGDFGPVCTLPAIKRWIGHAGGRYNSKVTSTVTHLVCSEAHWRSSTPAVKSALARGKNIAIVNYDWLEDCTQKKRLYHPRKYEWRKPQAKRSKIEDTLAKWGLLKDEGGWFGTSEEERARMRRSEQEKVEVVKVDCERELAKEKYQIFVNDGIKYDVLLVHKTLKEDKAQEDKTKEDNTTFVEHRYRLRLYNKTHRGTQSFASTKTYTHSSRPPVTHFIAGAQLGSNWNEACIAFDEFFKAKTGWAFHEWVEGVKEKRAVGLEDGWTARLMGAKKPAGGRELQSEGESGSETAEAEPMTMEAEDVPPKA